MDEYKLQIYNRWGNLIFESNNINESWNGQHKNINCEEDVYSYFISYKTYKNIISEYKKGTLLLK